MSDTTDEIVRRLRAAGCVFAEDEAALLVAEAESPGELEAMVDRRVAGLPLEHLLGWAQFCGLRIAVEPGVFVPRHRTEFLAQQAIALALTPSFGFATGRASTDGGPADRESAGRAPAGGGPADRAPAAEGSPLRSPVVVDLCCGAGAIGAAIIDAVPHANVFAADIDPAAVHSARLNITNGQVYQGDLFDALPAALRGSVEVLVANTPYVPSEAIALMPPEARLYEARVALDGGFDGLDVQRLVAAAAPLWLCPGGHLLVETSDEQAPATAAIFESCGMPARIVSSEELFATVVIGVRPLA
ncbi:methyltransferase [Subtercola lobariae]|uniref:N5-glutamine S-adenosyl-L-methionine-dependent methyltransferase n=1 Tax=Subtercola lobariae TaxID=1588641 RepID=A0A917EY22_9MICO|nr:methyltransferase [Subtercola lobariae]GGF29221.1 N5-glutamine S-adenosyl-L-methionine-dependent methyltransferase [Subtercola lobariae]